MVTALNLDDVVVVGVPLLRVSAAEVEALESKLWIKFPSGYREYMERLGEGVLGGTHVRMYPPVRIEQEVIEWRRRIHKYWFWEQTADLLPKERAIECVIIGDTVGGDQLIFHPCRPHQLFVLPRHHETAFEVGSNLLEAIDWMCSSGQISEAFSEREFEPNESRAVRGQRTVRGVIDPEGERLDDIVDLARRWVERHSAREWLPRHSATLERFASRYGGTDVRRELFFEGFELFEGDACSDGYVRKYWVIDSQSETRLGLFQVSRSDENSIGCSFIPQP